MQSFTLPAPAKINLFLHVLAQRPDGYHNIQTIFQFVDYCDELTFSLRKGKHFSFQSNLQNVSDENNLVLRAAKLLQQHTQCQQAADIQLKKVLPLGGGLGGGSSDAATTATRS